jgi:hypothetical protein
VRWLAVRVGHRSQAAPGRPSARISLTHRRGVRGPLPAAVAVPVRAAADPGCA